MNIPEAAIGPIIAAIVAGSIAFLISVLTKEQKTSEFRQQWIDSLRSDISEFSAIASELITYANHHLHRSEDEKEKIITENLQKVIDVQILRNRIILRLNRKEHKDFIKIINTYIDDVGEEMESQKNIDIKNRVNSISENLLLKSQDMLKKEWERVKKGERTYRITKMISLSVLLGAVALAAKLYFQ